MSDSLWPPRTIAHQAPPSMGFSRQKYWSRLPFSSPRNLPNLGIEPGLLHCRQMLYRLSHQGSQRPVQSVVLASLWPQPVAKISPVQQKFEEEQQKNDDLTEWTEQEGTSFQEDIFYSWSRSFPSRWQVLQTLQNLTYLPKQGKSMMEDAER